MIAPSAIADRLSDASDNLNTWKKGLASRTPNLVKAGGGGGKDSSEVWYICV